MSHSILDMAHPGIGALLVLGAFPDPPVLALGFLAAFSGFISVFALNDLMDWRIDTEKMAKYERALSSFDLDAMGFRHPIALGKLHFRAAFLWVVLWGLLSLGLAYTLRPLCAVILIAAVCLEIGYCRLLRVTHWKVLLSGSMVGIGALAGVCAITSSPPPGLVLLFFFLDICLGNRGTQHSERLVRSGRGCQPGDTDRPGPIWKDPLFAPVALSDFSRCDRQPVLSDGDAHA